VVDGAPLILVVEDDEAVRDLMVLALGDAGYRVVTATDGRDALDLLKQERPRLIMLDLRMPRLNGWEFAAAYHASPPPHAPIVVMTAGRDVEARAADVGAVGYLGKPFDLDELLAVVTTHAGEGEAP
jgi:CheY-like chemotaxis protein